MSKENEEIEDADPIDPQDPNNEPDPKDPPKDPDPDPSEDDDPKDPDPKDDDPEEDPEPKKGGGKKKGLVADLRSQLKEAKAELKANEEEKLKKAGDTQKLLEMKTKELEEALPKAEKWDDHQAQVSANQDKEIKTLKDVLPKEILQEKSKMIDSFSSDKGLQIQYLKDLTEAMGLGSFQGQPNGGSSMGKLTNKQINEKFDGVPDGLGHSLIAKAKSKAKKS